jgi:hypothetical protein
MRIAHRLSQVFEAWHRHKDGDLNPWMDVWLEAFNLAYFILGDIELAKEVAIESIRQINEQRPKRRHALFNLSHYQQSVRDKEQRLPKLRKPFLPDHQFLDLLIYGFSTPREEKKTALGSASRDDFDVWFVKCVIESSLKLGCPALRMMLGVSSLIRSYDALEETPEIWNELVRRVPRRQELWSANNEPFYTYWLRLQRDIEDRFGSLIKRDEKGNLVRRPDAEQCEEWAKSCFEWFKLRESQDQCLTSDVKKTGNDNIAELARVHAELHLKCYASLIEGTVSRLPARKIALPEYNMKLLSSNGSKKNRTPPKLTKQELDEVRGELRDYLNKRKAVTAVSLIVTTDGEEIDELSVDIYGKYEIKLTVPDRMRLLQVWARQAGSEEKVLLTGCPLAAIIGRRTIYLERGQKISLNIQYTENETGSGSYEVDVSYEVNASQRIRERLQPIITWYSTMQIRQALVRSLQYGALSFAVTALLFIMASFFAHMVTPRGGNNSRQIAVVQDGSASINNTTASVKVENTENNLPPQNAGNADSGHRQQDQVGPETVENDRRRPLSNSKTGASLIPPKPRKIRNSTSRASMAEERPSLADLHKIYVSDTNIYLGNDLNQQARESEMAALSRSNLFHVTEDKAKAQVFLQIVNDYRGARKQYARALLFTKKNIVLWQSSLVEVSAHQGSNSAKAEIDNLVQTISEELIKARTEAPATELPVNSQ